MKSDLHKCYLLQLIRIFYMESIPTYYSLICRHYEGTILIFRYQLSKKMFMLKDLLQMSSQIILIGSFPLQALRSYSSELALLSYNYFERMKHKSKTKCLF